MRSILQRATYLFWQYPSLWLPVLVADVLKFWVGIVGKHLAHIVTFAMLPKSVLDGSIVAPSGGQLVKAEIIGGLFEGGSNFIAVALYCCALGIMARMISDSGAGIEIGKLSWILPKRWCRFTGFMLLVFFAATFTGVLIPRYFFQSYLHHGVPGSLCTAIIFTFVAGFLAVLPVRSFIANNLEKEFHGDRVALQHPVLSSYVAMGIFGITYVALYQFGRLFTNNLLRERSVLDKPIFAYPLWMVNSLITAIPFIFVMIVLILIRQQELQESSDIPQEHYSFVDADANPF